MNVDAGMGADALAQAVVVNEVTGEGRDLTMHRKNTAFVPIAKRH